jgi:hypothetical protein
VGNPQGVDSFVVCEKCADNQAVIVAFPPLWLTKDECTAGLNRAL